MSNDNCDFSPLKQYLTEGIQHIIQLLQSNLNVLGRESYCVLGSLDQIKEELIQLESKAASYYLNCYLSEFTESFESLSVCVEHLSERKQGGLIVVERNELLDPLIQKGTFIGAMVTPKLLETIFYPGNPLHDGAVLIRGNVVVSAANVLPLSTGIKEGKKIGTRHRAALGITELSDALALVVSEETGKISFAFKGSLNSIHTSQRIIFNQ
nr:sporulation-specific diadenylate cyclase CdaS [Cytobacillus firmus]